MQLGWASWYPPAVFGLTRNVPPVSQFTCSSEKNLFPGKVVRHRHPRVVNLWILHPWKCLRSAWMGLWATWCGAVCPSHGRELEEKLWTQPLLWFFVALREFFKLYRHWLKVCSCGACAQSPEVSKTLGAVVVLCLVCGARCSHLEAATQNVVSAGGLRPFHEAWWGERYNFCMSVMPL